MQLQTAVVNGDQQVQNEEPEEEHQAPPEEALEAAENLVALNEKDVVNSAVKYIVAQEENEQESVTALEQGKTGVKFRGKGFKTYTMFSFLCASGD